MEAIIIIYDMLPPPAKWMTLQDAGTNDPEGVATLLKFPQAPVRDERTSRHTSNGTSNGTFAASRAGTVRR